MSNAELASSYAALILADEGLEITVRFFPDGIALPARDGQWAWRRNVFGSRDEEEEEQG